MPNIINIIHTYVNQGQSDVFLKTDLSPKVVGDLCAWIQFKAEENIDECVMIHEWLQAEIIAKFFGGEVVEEKQAVIKVDQYVAREIMCCSDNSGYNHYVENLRDSETYNEILQYIYSKPNGYDY